MAKTDNSTGWNDHHVEWVICLAVGSVGMVFIFGVIAYSLHRASIRSHQEKVARLQSEFDMIKHGHSQTLLTTDTELLPRLIEDEDCVKNLTRLDFLMVTFTEQDARDISKLSNVTEINFSYTYETGSVLREASVLPIAKLNFEQADLDMESLRQLAEFEYLREVSFGNWLSQEEIDALDSLPKHVTVKRPVEIRPTQ